MKFIKKLNIGLVLAIIAILAVIIYSVNIENERNEIDNIEIIKKYKELLDMGAITQEEFDLKKTELL